MNARTVKAALRNRHPAVETRNGETSLAPWTTLEEWMSLDLIAFSSSENPGRGARTVTTKHTAPNGYVTKNTRTIARHPVVGYEVKVSRADYRRDLVNPGKRGWGRLFCNEFYFATPKGLLKPEEVEFVPPTLIAALPEAFERERCPDCYDGTTYERDADGKITNYMDKVLCDTCRGRGWLKEAMVKQLAPSLFVPSDCGLVEVSAGKAKVVKPSPVIEEPPIGLDRGAIATLVRYTSLRPDPRHRRAA